jgi:hypothetical protein
LKILELTTIKLPNDVKEMMNVVENKKMEFQQLDNNMTKMYKHYKGHLTSSNARMILLRGEPQTYGMHLSPSLMKASLILGRISSLSPWFEKKFKN